MSSVRVVASAGAASGFALAGLPVSEVADVRSGASLIQGLCDREDIGVLLVEQNLLDALSESDRRDVMDRPAPIVVPFPSASWGEQTSPAEAYVLELLRRAIGYRVRLR
jgi:V/A-type H+-transporting ATPase subunit F